MAKRKKLIEGLVKAYNMLKHVSCLQGCYGGVIQHSEDEFEQCQWCAEVDEIRRLAGIEETEPEKEVATTLDDLPF